MKLHLRRLYRKEKYSMGKLFIDEEYFCDVIEDKDRGLWSYMSEGEIANMKIKHYTAIPYGKYKVRLSMSPKYKKVLPEILNVPGFSGVRIHSGNTADDSSGCIIVGFNRAKGKVLESRKTMEALMKKLTSLPKEEEIEIEITQ